MSLQNKTLRRYTRTDSRAARLIQQWFRRQLHPSNLLDYITMAPLQKPIFYHVSRTGRVTGFSARTLAEYLLATGNYSHPETRAPFLDVELKRLQKLLQQSSCDSDNDIGYESLVTRRNSLEKKRQDDINEASFQTYLENSVGCCINRMLQFAELHDGMHLPNMPLPFCIRWFQTNGMPSADEAIGLLVTRSTTTQTRIYLGDLLDMTQHLLSQSTHYVPLVQYIVKYIVDRTRALANNHVFMELEPDFTMFDTRSNRPQLNMHLQTEAQTPYALNINTVTPLHSQLFSIRF